MVKTVISSRAMKNLTVTLSLENKKKVVWKKFENSLKFCPQKSVRTLLITLKHDEVTKRFYYNYFIIILLLYYKYPGTQRIHSLYDNLS